MCDNGKAKEAEVKALAKQEIARLNASVELFKTVATFGFLAAAMFCVGIPLILGFITCLESCCRQTMTILSGSAGLFIVVCVLSFYWKLSRRKV